MQTAFVTGATGFLGRHVIDVLTEQGWLIYALVRDEDRARTVLAQPSVNFIKGDLTFPSTYRDTVPKGLDCIFHVAADTSTWAKEAARQHQINIEGTANLLQVYRDVDAKRFVHVSSIAVYGIHKNLVTEKTRKKGKDSWVSYVHTKTMAERKVMEAAKRGTDAVVVNPTHIVGRYDDHNWSRMIQMLDSGDLPGVPPGAGNFANGRAVAEAVVAAFDKGCTGENYILGGPYASMREFLCVAAEKLGVAEPKKATPAFVLETLASLSSIVARFTGRRPILTPEEAYFACEKVDTSSDKAVEELGYRIVPLNQSISESIDYLKAQGVLST